MAKHLTMKDIAKLAGVSQPTVSRVINGRTDVNEELAKRVKKVIDEVGFIPNKTARSLKQNQSHLIGISVSEMYNPYFVELINHIERLTRERGYNIILHNAEHNPLREWENIQNFLMRQVDGCIVVPTSNYNVEKMMNLSVPIVAITKQVQGLDNVSLDHMEAGREAARHFLKRNHRTFGYIGTVDDEKFRGFESELYDNGFTFNTEHFIVLEAMTSDHLAVRRVIDSYLEKHQTIPFTAVFTENDIIAVELKKIMEQRDIKVPEQLSIVGFDDTYFAKILGISSVQQPIEEMVSMALSLLINRIEQKSEAEVVTLKVQPQIIDRQSSTPI